MRTALVEPVRGAEDAARRPRGGTVLEDIGAGGAERTEHAARLLIRRLGLSCEVRRKSTEGGPGAARRILGLSSATAAVPDPTEAAQTLAGALRVIAVGQIVLPSPRRRGRFARGCQGACLRGGSRRRGL